MTLIRYTLLIKKKNEIQTRNESEMENYIKNLYIKFYGFFKQTLIIGHYILIKNIKK